MKLNQYARYAVKCNNGSSTAFIFGTRNDAASYAHNILGCKTSAEFTILRIKHSRFG